MLYSGFCGPSGKVQSPLLDSERSVNWYLERGRLSALYPTPGCTDFYQTTDVGWRGSILAADRCFVVIGTGLWEVYANNTATSRGAVAQDNNPATLSYNGVTGGQLGITSGGNWYNYDLASNVLSTVSAMLGKATMGGMKDARFLAFDVNTSTVYMSDLNDGTTWQTGTLFFQRTIAPDPWKAMVVGNPQIWMIGEETSEAWYDSGASPQPFAPILSSFMQSGTNASFSVAMADEGPVWVEHTAYGEGRIVRAQGYTPQTISNYAVSTALGILRQSASLDDGETFVYTQAGHTFAVFSFPQANATWAIDLDTGDWHERGTWNAPQNRYDYWHVRSSCSAFGKQLVGERATGMISSMDITNGFEADGGVIRRLRIGPPLLASSRQRLVVSRFSLITDTGLGLTTGQGSDPQWMARFSTDSRTWGIQRQASAGKLGQYGRIPFWQGCGSSMRAWMPEVSVSDPIPFRIVGAEIDGTGIHLGQSQGQAA